MKLYPESTAIQLEFDKVKDLLIQHCNSEYAKQKAEQLRIHTKKEYIELELQQSHEFKLLLQQSQYFPNDYVLNIAREIKLLGISGGTLSSDEFLQVRKLAESIEKIFRWFDKERRIAYPALAKVIENTYYEKIIAELIDDVIVENVNVKDNASPELQQIRMNL